MRLFVFSSRLSPEWVRSRAYADALKAAGFPVRLVDRQSGSFDDLLLVVRSGAVTNTTVVVAKDATCQTVLARFLDLPLIATIQAAWHATTSLEKSSDSTTPEA